MKKALACAQERGRFVVQRTVHKYLDTIVSMAGNGKNRAVLAVIITLLLKKAMLPKQNIRLHQAGMKGGFSGRGLDTQVVTPFLKENNFPAMASGSGWLTRSLEQNMPYNNNYPGRIRPLDLRQAFLGMVDEIETRRLNPRDGLVCLFTKLIVQRDVASNIRLARPASLPITAIIKRVEQHFACPAAGAARLPTLAIHAIYQQLIKELKRYKGCQLEDLTSHTAADQKTGLLGDIQITDARGLAMEAVEIKHNITLTPGLVNDCYAKFRTSQIKTFYLLSSSEKIADRQEIEQQIEDIRNNHGCQMIVNGIIPSLKYYLRMLVDTGAFVSAYVDHLENDAAISYEIKSAWNDLG